MRKLSGNHKAWIDAVAREIREAGKPVSADFLYRVVPNQFATATNDGHVTAAENGLSRDDFAAGWRIWIEETIATLIKAGLITTVADGYVWAAEQDGLWKVKFRNGTYTLYGKAESELSRDRHMLGEAGVPGYLLKGWSEVEVEVEVGAAGIAKGRHTLQVHPLAFAIPPMTPAEQEQVRADIAEHGVRMPLTLYPDAADLTARGKPKLKVLDGRHRLQFASALGKPVRVEVFEGSEQEAKQLVWSLNGVRRQMTTVQRALSFAELFGTDARAEAKQAEINGGKRSRQGSANLPNPSDAKTDPSGWEYRAWRMAGGPASGVSPRSIRAMAEVAKAPKTAAKVESGEIRSTEKAVREAKAEIAGTAVPKPRIGEAVSAEKSAGEYISHALYDLRRAAQVENPGRQTPAERDARLTEIIELAEQLRRGQF